MNKLFRRVGSLKPGRSVFDLSYEKIFTCDMGELVPVMCEEVVPGDILEIGHNAVVKFQPMVAPVMHEINAFVHYFFVPYRILFNESLGDEGNWEDFITGGVDGDDATVLPRWDDSAGSATRLAQGTLWDYLGFPPGIYPTSALPLDFPRRAYYLIYNDYYRDETLIDELDITDFVTNYALKIRAWEKDYFTSALLWQQRGTSPAIPIAGSTSAVWDTGSFVNGLPSSVNVNAATAASTPYLYLNSANARQNVEDMFNDNTVDFSSADPLDISDIRLTFQIQKWMERNARAGVRYTEFLGAHFGVYPRDDRLQRPEYIGGSRSPVIVSEVIQTSESNYSAQGTLTGKGLVVSNSYIAKKRVEEFGLIMGIMSVMPKPVYQQGINRQWLRESKYDFYFPEFAHLSEQAIIGAELFAKDGNPTDNLSVFGYQGQYDEMRVKQNMVCGQFRDTYDYWHISRQFADLPTLNQTFIECVPRKDFLAEQSDDSLMVQFGNLIKAIRPLPIIAEPGLIDHN